MTFTFGIKIKKVKTIFTLSLSSPIQICTGQVERVKNPSGSTNLSVLGHVVCVGEVPLEDDLGLARRLAELVQHVQLVCAVLADVGRQHVLF